MIKSQLLDARNWADQKDICIQLIRDADVTGFDIETCDPDRHEGLNEFMSENSRRLVFDVNRTLVTGFSFYPDGHDTAYYVNLAHADVENRVPWEEAKELVDAMGTKIAHNAPFEITMMRKSLGCELPEMLCTLQMAVSAHNEDQYAWSDMMGAGFGGLSNLIPQISKAFHQMNGNDLTEQQYQLGSKIWSKTSKAGHSYNGYVRDLTYGYGLKQLTKRLFDYDQTDFKTVLNGKAHMGELTGEEVCAYGADDAYWCVKIFHNLLPKMIQQNDKLLDTFLKQENPMIYVFADIWSNGLKINQEKVQEQKARERRRYSQTVRKLHTMLFGLLPYPKEHSKGLLQDGWYKKNPEGYRNKITQWAETPLPERDDDILRTIGGPVAKNYAKEHDLKPGGLNLSFYMTIRSILYDLLGLNVIIKEGKVQSDADARALLKGGDHDDLLEVLQEIADVEQRMKLYLNPYSQLIDPETSRVYPVVSSKLNSRRMAMTNPNGMQLAKRGASTYIRGFYEADEEDHVIVSIDWSQIELVEIGDFSGDPAFAEAYGQIPYQDLHKKAVADLLDIAISEVTKPLRNKIGKGANFNYWYSGALNTVGENMGWSSDKMWDATEKYRQTFAVAEQWRVDLIHEGRQRGYITLPDGHRRVKFEASYAWQKLWQQRWGATYNQGLINFGQHFVKKITNRAANQLVNSMIQGSCATLAKRSILRINDEINLRFRFLMPIHDELVFSVHKDDVVSFIRQAKRIMCDHPDIIQTLVMDATASMGLNFEPFHEETAPLGQIELDEAPEILGFTKDQKLNDDEIQQVVDYLFKEKENYAIAA